MPIHFEWTQHFQTKIFQIKQISHISQAKFHLQVGRYGSTFLPVCIIYLSTGKTGLRATGSLRMSSRCPLPNKILDPPCVVFTVLCHNHPSNKTKISVMVSLSFVRPSCVRTLSCFLLSYVLSLPIPLHLILTLGAHAQRGLLYWCVRVCVCLSVRELSHFTSGAINRSTNNI